MIAVVSPFQDVDLGPGQRRHESLHERAVGLVDEPLRLRGDRAEYQRRLARPGDTSEHRQPPLGDLDADVLQVVHPCALDANQVVGVCGVPAFTKATAGRLAGRGHARDHAIEYRRFKKTAGSIGSSLHVAHDSAFVASAYSDFGGWLSLRAC